MLLELKQITVPPGQTVIFNQITWQEFETLLDELGEHRSSRIAYANETLEIMTPLPEHEFSKELVSDLIKALLEELDIEFFPLGSTTFKNQLMRQGIEPDNCFFIQNEALVRNKNRLDLTIDPPPDLALEIDITSRTHLNIYATLGVPELWRFENGILKIYILQNGNYQETQYSPTFPNLPLTDIIPQYLQKIKILGRNATMKKFRSWIKKTYIAGNTGTAPGS